MDAQLDPTKVNSQTVLLTDLVTGYSYSPTITYEQGSSTAARIVITPDRNHEYNHILRVSTTDGIKYIDGTVFPPIIQDFTVQAAPKSQLVYDPSYLDLMIDRIKTGKTPWKEGYNDSGTNNGYFVGVFNKTGSKDFDKRGAEAFQNVTASAFPGNPSTYEEFINSYNRMNFEMWGCYNSILAYHVTGETKYRDHITDFIDGFGYRIFLLSYDHI